MNKPSPKPWAIIEDINNKGQYEIMSYGYGVVAGKVSLNKANARLIVRAVNYHDELIELATRIANEDHIWQDQHDDLTEQADAILRKIREQESIG